MKQTILIIILWCLYWYAFTQNPVYKQVKVQNSDFALEQLAMAGFSIDYISDAGYSILCLNPGEMEILKGLDLKYEISIDDMESYYKDRNEGKNIDEILNAVRESKDFNIPDGFSLGTMGGFCTYSEMLGHLDFMAENYPNLILPIDTIEGGTTAEGRPLYWTKISDNPQLNETEPEVLYTALIHAREPGSMQQMLFYMYYLLENYETDDEIKALVDHTEMYFIPCINPDGYLYNESISPEGGGMWRKNRRLVETGIYGVDNNRNFGYEWGHDDYGSSPNPISSTYRGPEAFSESEAQLVKSFSEQHEFGIALNYHSWGNLFLHPWGYVSYLYAPDHDLFQTYCKIFTAKNHYRYGNVGSLIYLVNGDVNDWMYGDNSEKPKCISFTPELGGEQDGFWPEIERIIPQCIESLHQNLEAARLAGEYVLLNDNNPFNLSKSTGYLQFSLQQIGLISSEITVSIQGMGDHFNSIGEALVIGSLDTMQVKIDSIAYSLRSGIAPGETLKYIIRVESGNFKLTDTIQKEYGPGVNLFSDSCGSMEHWESDNWGINIYTFHSAPASITDSPEGYYPNSGYSEVRLTDTIDLSNAAAASLKFYTKWRLDGGNDYASCRVSSNFGAGWKAMPGKYTKTDFVLDDDAVPVYCCRQDDWVEETIDLSEFCGEKILIKFTLNSDSRINKDGFYFDDLAVMQILAENYEQEIFLHAGWNSLSSYLIPQNSNMESIFGDILDDIEMIQHGPDYFQPQNPNNTLNSWDSHTGYQIKLSENQYLEFPGNPEYNRNLILQQGWNLIPVISSSPISVEALNIQPVGSWEIITQPTGIKINWPAKSIHSLDSLYPGESYFIKMNQAGTIEF